MHCAVAQARVVAAMPCTLAGIGPLHQPTLAIAHALPPSRTKAAAADQASICATPQAAQVASRPCSTSRAAAPAAPCGSSCGNGTARCIVRQQLRKPAAQVRSLMHLAARLLGAGQSHPAGRFRTQPALGAAKVIGQRPAMVPAPRAGAGKLRGWGGSLLLLSCLLLAWASGVAAQSGWRPCLGQPRSFSHLLQPGRQPRGSRTSGTCRPCPIARWPALAAGFWCSC
jgi:hypothetical protein